MRKRYIAAPALSLLMCSACVTPGASNVFGGGIFDSTLAKGVYRIRYQSNYAPQPNPATARSAWRYRAETLCGTAEFREVAITEGSHDSESVGPMMGNRYIHTTRNGYAVC